jgi:hypothetical protein
MIGWTLDPTNLVEIELNRMLTPPSFSLFFFEIAVVGAGLLHHKSAPKMRLSSFTEEEDTGQEKEELTVRV